MTNIIKRYNENKTYENYKVVINTFFPSAQKCKLCDGEIFYKDSMFRVKKGGEITIVGKSHLSSKKHGETLKVCEVCLAEKYPNFLKNKSRCFNTLNEITIFAFGITDNTLYKTGVTKEKMVSKYGEDEGLKRWESYIEKQSLSNSYDYKKEKYGWTSKQFDEFNKSRSITKEKMVSKYGEDEGLKRWESYIEKQRNTKSLEYMVSKYGYEKAIDINKRKALTIENFIRKYGDDGERLYLEAMSKTHQFYSKISQDVFSKLDTFLGEKYTTYYAEKNCEYGKMTSVGYKRMDYFIKELNACVEFNGDRFHANPDIFKPTDTPNPFNSDTAEVIRIRDEERYKTLLDECGIKTIVLWESEYKNKEFKIEKFLKDNGILF